VGRDASAAHIPGAESENQVQHRVRHRAVELAKERGKVLSKHVAWCTSQYLKTFWVKFFEEKVEHGPCNHRGFNHAAVVAHGEEVLS
jgi:hypothetical protein